MALQATLVPVVQAQESEPETKKIQISSISLYDEPEQKEYYVNAPSKLQSYIKDARVAAVELKQQYQPVIDKAFHIYGTGVAHTKEAVYNLREEDNLVGRIGAMSIGGILGLLAARRGRFLRKLTYTTVGVSAAGAICYPAETKVLAKEAYLQTRKGALIAYHFVVGARPEVQNPNGQAFDKVANMVSDVWQWGFRLFNGNSVQKSEENTVTPTEEAPVVSEPVTPTEEMPEEKVEIELLTEAPIAEEVIPKVEGDMGQATLEDSELYTTRG